MAKRFFFSLITLLTIVVTSEAQLKVRPDGSVHMGTTTITASSSEKEALLIVSPEGKTTSSIGFTQSQGEKPFGQLELSKDSNYKETSLNFYGDKAFIFRDYNNGRSLYRFQIYPPASSFSHNTASDSSSAHAEQVDFDGGDYRRFISGSGIDVFCDEKGRLFFKPMGYAPVFSIGSSDFYWSEAYIAKPSFKESPIITSDRSAKEQIEGIDADEAGLALLKLQPISYKLKENTTSEHNLRATYTSSTQTSNHRNYGLIAQEVMAVFPDIVEYDETSQQYGIRYVELIPILIATLQRQQQEIEALKALVSQPVKAKSQQLRTTTDISTPEEVGATSPKLWEAVPNPFSDQTSIAYYVPSEVTDAYIALLNLQGEMLESYPCTERGYKANVLISSDGLASGLYLYALIVDGVEVATHKLVVKN